MPQLVPVDGDPFAQGSPSMQASGSGPQLIPVDHDPFSKTFEQTVAPENVVPATMGALGKTALNDLEYAFPTATSAIKSGINAIGRSAPAQEIGKVLDVDKNAANNFVENHPAVNAIINGPVVGAAKDTAKVASLAIPAEGAIEGAAADIAAMPKPEPTPFTTTPVSDAGFAEAGKAYDAVKNSGAAIHENGVNSFLNEAGQNAVTDAKVAGAVGKSEATKYLTTGGDSGQGLMSLANEPISIQQVHAIDKNLTQQISKHFSDGLDQEGNQLMDLQDTFRKHFMTPDGANVTGGTQGFDAWTQANKLYSQSSKIEAVEKVVANAQNTPNPAQSIQNGLKNILKSAKKTRGYTDEELAALQEGARTGFAEDALRTFGGRIMTGAGTVGGATVGTMIGGPVGTAAGAAIGGGSSFLGGRLLRGSAAAMQERGANNLISIMTKDGLKYVPQTVENSAPAIEAQKLLPSPQHPYIPLVDAGIEALANQPRQLSNSQISALPPAQAIKYLNSIKAKR